jgi:hypothetical protein
MASTASLPRTRAPPISISAAVISSAHAPAAGLHAAPPRRTWGNGPDTNVGGQPITRETLAPAEKALGQDPIDRAICRACIAAGQGRWVMPRTPQLPGIVVGGASFAIALHLHLAVLQRQRGDGFSHHGTFAPLQAQPCAVQSPLNACEPPHIRSCRTRLRAPRHG